MDAQQGGLIHIQYLQELLDNFSRATGLHVAMVDNEGRTMPLLDSAERCAFCQYIRSLPNGLKKCRASYTQASDEASKWEEPYFFRCRAGLVIWVVPIIVNGTSLGSIICSQILLWEPDRFFFQELRKLNPEVPDFKEMEEKVSQLEIVSPDRFQAAADVLFIIIKQLLKRDYYVLEKIGEHRMQQQIYNELEQRKKERNEPEGNTDYNNYLKQERSFLRYVRMGDAVQTEKLLQPLLTALFIKTTGEPTMLRMRVTELASLIARAAVDGGVEANEMMNTLQLFHRKIASCMQMEEFFFQLQQLVSSFLHADSSREEKKYAGMVNDAKNYIIENYSQNIKIEDIAEHLYISPSHLSRMFRQEQGCTVNDYITRVRVEQAVEFLKKPEFSVAQVSQAVGFQSQSYFAKVFNRYIGVAPLTYRNSLS